tara:strand:+ start:1386 stop:1646 length:261 start_codon:yes stop_codon:yes gene_type:complete
MPFKMKGHTLPGINQKGNKTVKGAVPKMYADKAAPKMYDAPVKEHAGKAAGKFLGAGLMGSKILNKVAPGMADKIGSTKLGGMMGF